MEIRIPYNGELRYSIDSSGDLIVGFKSDVPLVDIHGVVREFTDQVSARCGGVDIIDLEDDIYNLIDLIAREMLIKVIRERAVIC